MNELLNTNSQNSQFSLRQIELGKIHKGNEKGKISALKIGNHKEVYEERNGNSTNQAGLNTQLIRPKENTPRTKGEEINRLAKTWCELLLNQIQEHNQPRAIDPNTEENKYRGFLINH